MNNENVALQGGADNAQPEAEAVIVEEVVAIQEEAPEQPKRNRLRITLIQDAWKEYTVKGEKKQKQIKHHAMFSDETEMELTSENVSTYILGRLTNYQLMQKLQGRRERFDETVPIELSIEVNGRTEAAGIKFSTSTKTLERILDKYPTVVAMVFNPQTFRIGTKKEDILKIASGVSVTLAKAIEAPAAQPLLENVPVANDAADVNA